MDAVGAFLFLRWTGNIIVIVHDQPVFGVDDGALVAFDVQLDAGVELDFRAVEGVVGADDSVVGDCEEGAAQRVEMCDRGCIGVAGGLLGRVELRRTELAADALLVPGLPSWGLGLEVIGDIARDIRVGAWVAGFIAAGGDCVVDVVGRLLPGVEEDFLIGVVGCSVALTRSSGS